MIITPPATIADMEAALRRIGAVTGVAIVVEPDGRIADVHVTSNGTRPPKTIIRDIETTLHAVFRIHIDYRVVSVADLGAGATPNAGALAELRRELAELRAQVVYLRRRMGI